MNNVEHQLMCVTQSYYFADALQRAVDSCKEDPYRLKPERFIIFGTEVTICIYRKPL
jgi:hypothetical protein